jgi:hypothetical protein
MSFAGKEEDRPYESSLTASLTKPGTMPSMTGDGAREWKG